MADGIFMRLKSTMNKILPNDDITLGDSLKDDLDYDSLELINLYFEIESEFKIDMANEDLSEYELDTVKHFVEYIRIKLSNV